MNFTVRFYEDIIEEILPECNVSFTANIDEVNSGYFFSPKGNPTTVFLLKFPRTLNNSFLQLECVDVQLNGIESKSRTIFKGELPYNIEGEIETSILDFLIKNHYSIG